MLLSGLSEEIKELSFVKLLIPYAIGIIAAISFNIPVNSVLVVLPFALAAVIYTSRRAMPYNKRHLYGLALFVLLAGVGVLNLQHSKPKAFPAAGEYISAFARLTEPLEEKENSYKSILNIEYFKTEKDSLIVSEHKVIAYFEKSDSLPALDYGDYIIFRTRISEISNAGNPHEFDYERFLFRRGIRAQCYIRADDLMKSDKQYRNPLFAQAFNIREYLIGIYKQKGISGKELAVLQALTLGEKSELTRETRRSYVVSGAMHVLAVSGLHVGIIYMILAFLFKFLDRFSSPSGKEYGKVIKAVLIILLIWFFAMLSGLSPSVRRAAVMFTFFAIGKTLNRSTSIYNSLAVSAFLLLTVNPFLLTEVGFQLSYSAVFSIVFFQPKISALFTIKNVWLGKLWDLTAVSIAAQIGTTPVSLFYFNIFPNYFWLTNLFVIFMATFIVYGAALLFAVSFIPYVSDAVAYLLKQLVFSMNYLVESVEALPHSATDNIVFDEYALLASYLLIIGLTAWLIFRRSKYLFFSLFVAIAWSGRSLWANYSAHKQDTFFVYNVNKASVYQYFTGGHSYLIADEDISKQDIEYAAKGNMLAQRCTDYKQLNFTDSLFNSDFAFRNDYLYLGGKSGLIISESKQLNYNSEKALNLNFLIIRDNPYLEIEEISRLYDADVYIFDSSNSYYHLQKWKAQCDELELNCVFVSNEGAYSTE